MNKPPAGGFRKGSIGNFKVILMEIHGIHWDLTTHTTINFGVATILSHAIKPYPIKGTCTAARPIKLGPW